MQKRTILQLALALVALAAIMAGSTSGALAATDPDTEIRYYRMSTFTGADANGTQIKVLAPQQDMSYPRNCTLYMVVSNYGAGILEVRAGGQLLGTVAPKDLSMITFSTLTGSNNAIYPLELVLDGKRLLVISYVLTSVSFELVNETNLPQMEQIQAAWQDRLNKERALREWNTTIEIDQDVLAALEAARTPILICSVLGVVGIFSAFAVKWGSRLISPLNGINYGVLILAALLLGLFDVYTGLLKGNLLYFVPFAAAYMGTYYLYRLPTVSTARMDIKEHRLTVGQRVYYEDAEDGQWCEALQDWRRVLARWVRGDRCIVTANGSLVPDWTLVDNDTLEESPLLMVNSEKTADVRSKPIEEQSIKERILGAPGDSKRELNLAKGGQFSHVDYLVNPDGWTKIMQENQRQFQAIHRLLSSIPTLSRSLAEEIIEYIHGYRAEEPTRLFRTFIIRTLQRDPMAMIDGDIWERYQKFKDSRPDLGKLVSDLDNEIKNQERPLDRDSLQDPDLSAGHMSNGRGAGQ
jgi:hypothetical protein